MFIYNANVDLNIKMILYNVIQLVF